MDRTKTCLYCGKLLTKKQYWKYQKYCSSRCFAKARRKIKYCETCKELLTQEQRHNRFCSKKCWGVELSQFLKGKKPCLKAIEKTRLRLSNLKGKNNYNWKNALKTLNCVICGREFKRFESQMKDSTNKLFVCSRKCANILQQKYGFHKRERNANWRNGISKEPYPFEFDEKLKNLIRKRDGYVCQLCGKTEKTEIKNIHRRLTIHHIDYNKRNLNPINLITFCNACNLRVNWNRKLWQQIFQNKVEQIKEKVQVQKLKVQNFGLRN